MAPTIDELVIGDPPEAWVAAGYTVDADGTCRIGTVRLRLAGRDDGKRIRAWSLRDLPVDVTEIDGLPTTASTRVPAEPAAHGNGVRSIDHLVLITPDVERTITALGGAGIEPRRTRTTDTYGTPMRQTFFRMGEVILELIGPDEPTGDTPAAFLGLALTVADLDATQAFFGEHLPNVKDAVQPGRRIGTLRHKELGLSVATAFMSAGPGALELLDDRT